MNQAEYDLIESVYDKRVERFAKTAVTIAVAGVLTYFWFDSREKNAEHAVKVTPAVEEYFELQTRLNNANLRYTQFASEGVAECDSLGLETRLEENLENSNNSVLESMKEDVASLERAIEYANANNHEVKDYRESITKIREQSNEIKRLALVAGVVTPFLGFMAYLLNSQLKLRSMKSKLKD